MNLSIAPTLPRTLMGTWPGRLVALVVVGAVIGGVTLVARGNGAAPKVDLRTTTVTRGSVTQTVSVSGSVNASGQARLSFKTGGKLDKVYVVTGQTVALGQPLAKLDTTDLETALATAQQNVANAQANYQKALLSASDTQQSLADTQHQGATNISNAQQSLAKLKTNYATAKTNYGTYSVGATTDTAAFQTDIETTRVQLEAVLTELLTSGQTEVKAAQNAIYLTFTPIANIAANNTSQLQPALDDYQRARNALLSAVSDFDNAFGSGADTTATAAAYQTAQVNFSLATSRLSSALDTTSAGFSGIQGNVVSAQGQLTTSVTKYIGPPYDQWRADLSAVYTLIGNEQTRVATAKLKLAQATSALTTITDVTSGSLANATQAVSTAQDNAAQSLRNAQNAVANIPLNLQSSQVSVDNANNALTTAKSNLDAAVLTAPAQGIVASIANQVGEFVSGGNTNSAFMVLTNTTSMVLHGTVGEADVAKLKLGQVANLTVDALSGQKMTGKVTSLDPVATISQGVPVYGIDIAIDVPATTLKAGMSGTANVILASKQNVLTVPNTTIRTVNGQRGVQVLKGGEVVDTAVTFGLTNDTVTEVVTGLAEGDTVVIPQARASTSAQPNRGGGGPGGVIIGR
jgi:RND family efflux transporter MFP subunit